MRIALAGVLFGVTAASVAVADDKIVALNNPGSVAIALRDMGYRAKLDTDENRPVIDSGAGGTFFSIRFYGCDGAKDCSGMLFEAGFDLDEGFALDSVNDWNREKLLGRAYLDGDCDPWIDHFLIADPLMSRDAFAEMVQEWGATLGNFRSFVGYDEDTGAASISTCGQNTAT